MKSPTYEPGLKGSIENRLGEFFNIELVSSTRRTVVVKLVLFSYASWLSRTSLGSFTNVGYRLVCI